MKGESILVADDEDIALDNFGYILSENEYEIVSVRGGDEALKLLRDREFDLVLTDLRMPGVDGMEILKFSRERYPDTEVILITGYATIDTAIEAMRVGAYHYITKPYKIDEVRKVVGEALEKKRLKKENRILKQDLKRLKDTSLMSRDPLMRKLLETARSVADSDCNILITGESGTGKELLARYIHEHSNRRNGPMVGVNCGVFTEELLASELFGYEKGAFTGADRKRTGIIESTDNGTLLLDEITEMSLTMQVKLLRVLQEKEVMPVGSNRPRRVSVRFISATNRDIDGMVKEGLFRQDLYYRINVVNLHLPPLSDRKLDLPILVQIFIEKFNTLYSRHVERVTDEVMRVFEEYDFPGNIRELEHLIERAIVLVRGDVIGMEHIPELRINSDSKSDGRILTLDEYEKNYIEWVLKKTEGKKAKAAEVLGIDRVSLWRKLKRFGYDDSEEPSDMSNDDR